MPAAAEALPGGEQPGPYEELLAEKAWSLHDGPEEITIRKEGRSYRALLCRNTLQAQRAIEEPGDYDVIRILA